MSPASDETRTLVAFRDVAKTYPNGTVALRDVTFEIEQGAVHAICGENGAGKSTLMKVLFGLEAPTQGMIEFDGQPLAVGSPVAAAECGIGMVHQHFSLVPSLSVAENIFLGNEPRKGLLIDRAAARQTVRDLCERYNLHVDPDVPVNSLSVAAQQKVEILKALSRDVRLLILDEPTAVLTPQETDELFDRLRGLQDSGLTIVFISHKLREVRALASHVTVLRGGRMAGDAPLADISDAEISELVMGRAVESAAREGVIEPGEFIVEMNNVSLNAPNPADRVHAVSLNLRAGEIVGVAGVDGSGQRGLVSLLTGHAQPDSGTIQFRGRDVSSAETTAWRDEGLAHLPADRFHQGCAPPMSLTDNAIAGAHSEPPYAMSVLLNRAAMERSTEDMIREFDVRCQNARQPISSLSGGNAQKLIAARELATQPAFMVADQPTRGIDVAAAAFLHRQLNDIANEGVAILLVSADLDELLRLSDRLVVLFDGEIVARMENGPDVTPASLGPYMLGMERAA